MPSPITAPMPRLEHYRRAFCLSRLDLARRAGISEATITRLERHHGGARPETVAAIAAALKVKAVFLTAPAAPAPPAPAPRPAQHPSMPAHTAPSLDLAAIDPTVWRACGIISFAERAPAARARRQLRRDAQRGGRSHREPWA